MHLKRADFLFSVVVAALVIFSTSSLAAADLCVNPALARNTILISSPMLERIHDFLQSGRM